MRLIDGDVLLDAYSATLNTFEANGLDTTAAKAIAVVIKYAPGIDAIPIGWLEQRLDETAEATADGKDESELNNAIFTVLVEWEKHKDESEGKENA